MGGKLDSSLAATAIRTHPDFCPHRDLNQQPSASQLSLQEAEWPLSWKLSFTNNLKENPELVTTDLYIYIS